MATMGALQDRLEGVEDALSTYIYMIYIYIYICR